MPFTVAQLKAKLAELPDDTEVFVYCESSEDGEPATRTRYFDSYDAFRSEGPYCKGAQLHEFVESPNGSYVVIS